ncbi:MAG: SH3 domain-containing protein [Acidobacteriota bacterium]
MQHPGRVQRLFLSLTLVVSLVTFPKPSQAAYSPPPIYDLLGVSELIVLGSISKVGIATFQLDVEEVLRGSADGETRLEIEKFEDWVCSSRWQPYQVDQRVVVFLSRDGDSYKLRSAGSEGEFPIFGRDVFVHGYVIDGMDFVEEAGDARIHGYRLPLDVFRSLVSGLSECFAFEIIEGRWRRIGRIQQRCDPTQIEQFQTRSPLHRSVVKGALAAAVSLEEMNQHRACQVSLEPSMAAEAVALIRERGHVALDNWYERKEVKEITVEPDGPFEKVQLNGWPMRPTVTYLPLEDGTLENLGSLLGCENGHLPAVVPLPFSAAADAETPIPPRTSPQVLGLARIPGLFGDYRGLPTEPQDLQLLAEPSVSGATAAWIAHSDQLVSRHLNRETRAAVVRERRGDWIRLVTKNGEEGWVSIKDPESYRSLEWLSKWRQMTVTEDWDGLLYGAPELTAERRRMSPIWREYLVNYSQAVDIEVKETRWIGPILWLHVEVMSASACQGPGYPEVMAEGWIPAHSSEGESAVWFRPTNC